MRRAIVIVISLLCITLVTLYSIVTGRPLNLVVIGGVILALSVELCRAVQNMKDGPGRVGENILFILNLLAIGLIISGFIYSQ